MGIKYANNAASRIIAGISPSDTTIPLETSEGALFPSLGVGDWFVATIVNASGALEIVKVIERSGDILTVERAQEGTVAQAFSIGSRIELRLTAGAFSDIIQGIKDEAAAAILDAVDTIAPVGSIIIMSGNYVPSNFIKPNGAIMSRILYPRLWEFANTHSGNIVNEADWDGRKGAFSRGDGSTTFRIPDLRGMFPRFWDDGRGIDTGRVFGSEQLSQNLSHSHGASDNGHKHGLTDPGHNHAVTDPGHDHPLSFTIVPSIVGIGAAGVAPNNTPSTTGNRKTGITINNRVTGISMATGYASIAISSHGGTEARPRNVAYLPLLRYA